MLEQDSNLNKDNQNSSLERLGPIWYSNLMQRLQKVCACLKHPEAEKNIKDMNQRSWQEITRCLLYQIRIYRNHIQGAILTFLLGFCLT